MTGTTATGLPLSSSATNVKYADKMWRTSHFRGSSHHTFTPTSIDVWKTLFTLDFKIRNWPMWTGCRKLTWSTAAVTADRRECRSAAKAPHKSTKCNMRPPSTFPSMLASFGSATYVYSEQDSPTGRPFRTGAFAAIALVLMTRPHALWARLDLTRSVDSVPTESSMISAVISSWRRL